MCSEGLLLRHILQFKLHLERRWLFVFRKTAFVGQWKQAHIQPQR